MKTLNQNLLEDKSKPWSFVKLVRGPEEIIPTDIKNVYSISRNSENYFTQQVSLWRRKDLVSVYSMSADSEIARTGGIQQETLGSQICMEMGFNGLLYYENEMKRGLYHYDSTIVPHICTAIVGGKWNISEYKNELYSLFNRYQIDPNVRGLYK